MNIGAAESLALGESVAGYTPVTDFQLYDVTKYHDHFDRVFLERATRTLFRVSWSVTYSESGVPMSQELRSIVRVRPQKRTVVDYVAVGESAGANSPTEE